ncbi:MAG: hypothetical protein ACIAQ0_08180 [Phycisphaerales bacterium JB058]
MRTLANASLGCGLVLVAGSAMAGPPVARHIDPDARWVLHVDLEELNSTEIGSFLMDMVADETDDFEEIREVMPNFWPGPEGGMFGVTLYGSQLEFEDDEVPEDFCAVIYGNGQIRGWGSMLEAIALHEGFENKLKKREIHGSDVWSMPMEDGGRIYAGLVEGRQDQVAWVVSFDSGRIERSLAFFDDREGGNELLPRDGWRDGTVAFVASDALGEIPMDRKASQVIGEAKSFKVRIGEVGASAFLQMSLDTGDSEKAQSVMSVGQGLMAIGHLAAADDEELAAVMRVVQGLKITTSGTSVLVDFEHDAGSIVEFLRESGEFDVDVDDRFDRDDDDDDHDEGDAW